LGTITKKLEDIKHIEELLDIQIKVVCAENLNTLIYSREEKETKIYLYKNGNHFDVINSMKAFLGSCYYCEKCDKPYANKKGTNVGPRVIVSVNSAKDRRIHSLRKVKYIAKTATDTSLIKPASRTTQAFAKKFISAKTVMKLN